MSRALGKSEGDEGDQDSSDKTEATDQYYPGLNKRHGFFRAIERNQVDREVYHRDRSEWRDQRKKQTDKEVMEEVMVEKRQMVQAEQDAKDDRRRRRRDRQRPDRAMYQPPRARLGQPSAEPSPLYKLEIEVKSGVVWKTQVSKAGEAAVLAQSAANKYSLDRTMESAIEDFIQQFEKDLKL